MTQGGGDPMTDQPVYLWPAYPEQNVARPSKTLAVLALALAIVPLGLTWVAAIALAVVVLVRIQTNEARGRGLAIAALIISSLWIMVAEAALVSGIVEDEPQPHSLGMGLEANWDFTEQVSLADVAAGDCLVRIPTANVDTLTSIPCSKPHRGEVFATFSVAVGPHPTRAEIKRSAERECTKRFESYFGIGFDQSVLDYYYLWPQPSAIDYDDGVICTATEGSKKTVGSLKNAKR